MFFRIVSIIFPIFAIVGVGYVYARFKKPEMRFANQLNMDVFVPALVFSALAGKDFDLVGNWKLAVGACIVILGSGLLSWPVAKMMKVPVNSLLPPMMFNNSGNMGLPLAVLAFGEATLPLAVVLFFVENAMHYALGTWMLDHRARLLNLWRVPVIAASICGVMFSVLKIEIWQPLYISIKLLGDISVPLLLFSLGVRLTNSVTKDIKLGLVGAILCPVSGMVMAWVATHLLGLDGVSSAMLTVFGALPPAVLNYMFAEKYHQEPERVASIVMIGNIASLLFIPLALYFSLPR